MSPGSAIAEYPVIFGGRGADSDAVQQGRNDLADIVPGLRDASPGNDGAEEVFTPVSLNWNGNQ